ncbi:MAG: DUF3418 domain-containing protein, partial [Betaproteobacteria bacterium]|nr:DUF3418 domain-containing protein [Betaproteobacteria bacterium]
ERENPRLLYLGRDYLMRHTASGITEERFPDGVTVDGICLPLAYRFDPGHVLDGVTVTVPLPLLNKLNAAQFDCLVPGLIREKITWYLKALPKQIRRHVVPVPEFVTAFLEYRETGSETASSGVPVPLAKAMAGFIQFKTGITVPPDTWQDEKLPVHLLMNYRIVDDASRELAMSRDLAQLKTQLGQAARLTFSGSAPDGRIPIERDNVTRWDFGDLPEEIAFVRTGKNLTGYPALVSRDGNVSIRLFDTRETAQASMRGGVRQLLRFELKEQMKQLEKDLSGQSRSLGQAVLQLHALISPDALREDMLSTIADRAFIGNDTLPRTEKEFAAQKQRARTRLPVVTEAVIRMTQAIAHDVQALLNRIASTGGTGGTGKSGLSKLSVSRNDAGKLKAELNIQLRKIVYPGFLGATSWDRLQHLPRYLKGMALRLDKYSGNPERDIRHAGTIAGLWQQYEQRLESHRKAGISDPNLAEFRWQIEELRISLFAQELKTPYPVSVKRLQKLWEEVNA